MYQIQKKYYSIEEIFSELSQEQIWEYYLGFPPVEGKPFLSPLRVENDPSASLFYSDDGKLLLHDFVLGTFNIWQFIVKRYELSFSQAVQKVANDFGLGSDKQVKKIEVKRTFVERPVTKVEISLGKWTPERINYWKEYHLDGITIKKFKVVPVDAVWINGNMVHVPHLTFSYEFGGGIRKIYSPFGKNRFISNVPGSVYSGYEQLPEKGDLLIITSSHKDVMCWSRIGYCAISPQTESPKFPAPFLAFLRYRFSKIILNYDDDPAGHILSSSVSKLTGLPEFFVPEYGEISEYLKIMGLEHTQNESMEWLKNM